MGANKNSNFRKCGDILINIKTIKNEKEVYSINCGFCNAEYEQIEKFLQHIKEHLHYFESDVNQTGALDGSPLFMLEPEIIKTEEQTELDDMNNRKMGYSFTPTGVYDVCLEAESNLKNKNTEKTDTTSTKKQRRDSFDNDEECWTIHSNNTPYNSSRNNSDEDSDKFQKSIPNTYKKGFSFDDETSVDSKDADIEVNLSDIVKMLKKLDKKVDAIRVQNEKIDAIKDNFEKFKNDIRKQNCLIVSALSENNIAIKNIVKNQSPKFKKMFPIRSLEQLETLENSINDSNEQEFIATIRCLIGERGLKKGLVDIMIPDVLVLFNVDGIHNKKRLLNYKKFINILFMASYEKNSSENSFKDDLKYALKLAKNRYFKEKMKEKKEMVSDT